MVDFLKLIPPKEALTLFEEALGLDNHGSKTMIPTSDSYGYILAEDIRAPHSLPTFFRSTVDGYAVRSIDTYGSSDANPTYLEIVGEVLMGSANQIAFQSGQVVVIHTGGMLPADADSVIMVEDTQKINDAEIEVFKGVSPNENVLSPGEDIREGDVCFRAGKKIRSVEIGGLLALGITSVQVVKKPIVAIISSGDEIVDPTNEVKEGFVRDINSYLLAALITKWGGEAKRYGIIPDNLDKLLQISKKAYDECDIVIFTAGSSVSIRDITADAIKSLGEPGVIIHGVNIRPGKPTILAICSGKPVIGLPGNPVSAFVTANIFVKHAIYKLCGSPLRIFDNSMTALLETNIPSKAGREDWVPVKIRESTNGFIAEPIFSRSNFIFSLVSADGLICIPANKTGIHAGEEVQIIPID